MSVKPSSLTREQARELKRRADQLDRSGGGIPHQVVRARWLAKLGRELREMVRAYDGTARAAKRLLEAILIAEEEGVPDIAEIRHELLARLGKKRAA
jgi:hypothetical protein